MTLKSMLDRHSNGHAKTMLTGSDLPVEARTITIEVAGVREPPEGFDAPAIFELKEPISGKSDWPVNRTNLKTIIRLFGDEVEDVIGKKIMLEVTSARNPKTGEMVPSLAVNPRQ
jgi:hypothetical protein